jgi:hypothetical protein
MIVAGNQRDMRGSVAMLAWITRVLVVQHLHFSTEPSLRRHQPGGNSA